MASSSGGNDGFVPPRPPLPPARTASARAAEPGRWPLVLALVGAASVLVLAIAATATAVPGIIANATGSVSDGTHAFPLTGDGERASVLAPAGWIVVRAADETVVLRSPDDAVSATVTLIPGPAEEAMAGLLDAVPDDAGIGTERHETLASGLPVAHVDVTGAADDLLAVIALDAPGSSATATVVVDVAEGKDPGLYRAAIAEILEGVAS